MGPLSTINYTREIPKLIDPCAGQFISGINSLPSSSSPGKCWDEMFFDDSLEGERIALSIAGFRSGLFLSEGSLLACLSLALGLFEFGFESDALLGWEMLD